MELVEEPSFFKILINDFSIRLQIPPALTSMFGQDVPNKTIVLETYLGKSGEVKLEKLGSRFYFNNGWSDFVKANNLEQGDLLLFKYFADDPKFKVTIYGKTCCVKQFNGVRERCFEPLKGTEDQIDHNGDDQIGGHVGKSTCKQQTQDQKTTKFKKSRVLKYRRLLPDKNQIKFTSDNPFFQVQLKCSNVTDYLYIPTRFFREHMMKENKRIKFEISQKSWSATMVVVTRTRKPGTKCQIEATVKKGWKIIAREHSLQVGDVCFFEMIKSDDSDGFVFCVHAYRWDSHKAGFCKIF